MVTVVCALVPAGIRAQRAMVNSITHFPRREAVRFPDLLACERVEDAFINIKILITNYLYDEDIIYFYYNVFVMLLFV